MCKCEKCGGEYEETQLVWATEAGSQHMIFLCEDCLEINACD